MRKKRLFVLLKISSCSISAILSVLSIFAVQIGLDNDPGWGTGRIVLLLAGAFFASIFVLLHFPDLYWKMQQIYASVNHAINHSKIVLFLQTLQNNQQSIISKKLQRFLFGIIGIVLLIFTIQSLQHSKFVHFETSNYYNQLADGFLSGKTSLPEKPPAALGELENPYNWLNREGIEYLWDATYYQGEYYLYWGMVPALIAAAIKLVHPMIILDHYLVFGFYFGICFLMALLYSAIHRNLFPNQPAWLIVPFTWISGLAMPVFWLTTRPSVYEAAIASGQFFLLAGIYGALQILWSKKQSAGWLLLTGFCWGAAVNSRFSLVFTVFWLAGFLALVLLSNAKNVHSIAKTDSKQFQVWSWIKSLLWLAIPLLVWAAALLGYNFLRFGNIFEMGHRYQLNGPGMPGDYTQVMSFRYVLPSLYSYLIRPLQFEWHTFPYVSAPYISESMWPFFIRLPEYYYYPEPTAGILLTTPIVWIALFPWIFLFGKRFWLWINEKKPTPKENIQFTQFEWLLTGTVTITFFFLLVFNAASMRYLADITPMLLLLAISGTWWTLQKTKGHTLFQILFSLVCLILIGTGGLFSIFAGFKSL